MITGREIEVVAVARQINSRFVQGADGAFSPANFARDFRVIKR